jgi:hypothetical protein
MSCCTVRNASMSQYCNRYFNGRLDGMPLVTVSCCWSLASGLGVMVAVFT